MAEVLELLHNVPVFAGIPEDQVDWFLAQSETVPVKAGQAYARQGDPAEWMFVLLEGEFQWRGEFSGETVLLDLKAGTVTGTLPFSRMKNYGLTGRALTDGIFLRFPSSQFPQLVQRMPELTTRLVGLMSDRIREITRFEQQRDRLAALGIKGVEFVTAETAAQKNPPIGKRRGGQGMHARDGHLPAAHAAVRTGEGNRFLHPGQLAAPARIDLHGALLPKRNGP